MQKETFLQEDDIFLLSSRVSRYRYKIVYEHDKKVCYPKLLICGRRNFLAEAERTSPTYS